MEFVPSLLNTAMESILGVLLPDPNGACALLPRLMDELDELKHLKSTDSLDFPGSTMSFTPPERCIWMKKIYEDRPIGQIVWPATHNSATNKIGINFITRPFGQHQTLSIYYQLRNGVRALDIRVQQDGQVCNGNFLSYSMTDVITDIKKFMSKTLYEIIILEIQTERGYMDPPDFESYLVHELGNLLINQDDHVFSKTISEVLPGRIICIWKPKNSPKPSEGGPIWSASYLRGDEFETELPHTKLKANLINLSQQIPASERNYFYKVEHLLTPQTSSEVEWLLVWPRHAKIVSKRINEFAWLFLSNCDSEAILDRLQIYSTDFINDDFIVACIALNYSMDIKVKNLEVQLGTTKQESIENMLQAVTKEKNRATQIPRDLEELRKEFEDEKVQMEATKNSILIEKERLMGELGDARKHIENMLETLARQDEAARTSEAQLCELRDQLQQSKKALEDAFIKHAVELAKILPEYSDDTFATSDNHLLLYELSGKKCYMIAATHHSASHYPGRRRMSTRLEGEIRMSILSPQTLYFVYVVFEFSKHHRRFYYSTLVGPSNRVLSSDTKSEPDGEEDLIVHGSERRPKERNDGWKEIRLGSYSIEGGELHDQTLKMDFRFDNEEDLIVHGFEIRPN